MNNKPSQNNTEAKNPEINNTETNDINFCDLPDDVITIIFPFLGLKEIQQLSLVNKAFRSRIEKAFTDPNIYSNYPGMFEVLHKFWHANPVAFQKWFKLYRIDKIQTSQYGVLKYNKACDDIFNKFQRTDDYVDENILNNALETVFQNSTNDITKFLLPLVSNANQFALYRTFGRTALQKISESKIERWTDRTAISRKNIHTLLFCLLTAKYIEFFNRKHQVLNHWLDYAEKNIGEFFGQETIKKYGEDFIKALLQSCRLTLDTANGTKPTAEEIKAIRKDFPNVPINFEGANLRSAKLGTANLTSANLEYADLRGADLRGANLSGAKLSGANLNDADLRGANLRSAKLRGAKLYNTDLTNTNLTCVNLRGASFSKTKLTGAKLTGAKLTNANLWRVNLTGVNLTGADLSYADLTDANLNDADLTGANLIGAKLRGADLTGANLTGAKLTSACLAYTTLKEANWSGADLCGAYLSGADLRGAKLSGADLSGANLMNTDLTGANLNDANLFGCAFSPNTKLEDIKIDSTSLLSVFIDGRNPQNATTNIWSLTNLFWSLSSAGADTFKRLLPHADIKELEILMKGVKKQISLHPCDLILGPLKKASILKLISDEIAKKQAPQKMECEEPTQKESTIGNSQQQNSSAINSTLALPNQNANTTTLNTELGENENHETDLNLAPNQSP